MTKYIIELTSIRTTTRLIDVVANTEEEAKKLAEDKQELGDTDSITLIEQTNEDIYVVYEEDVADYNYMNQRDRSNGPDNIKQEE